MSFPLLDVSELTLDPMFVETVTVYRRKQVMVKGRATFPVVQVFENVLMSIQPKDTVIGGNVIDRGADAESRGSNFNAYTQFRLSSVAKRLSMGVGEQYAPDVVLWNGDHFLVSLTNDFSHYGAGYMHAEIVSTEPVDYAPDGGPTE